MTERKESAHPEIPGFSWKPSTYNLNGRDIPSFVVTWATDAGAFEAEYRKKLPLGHRIAAQEAFGETSTDEGRVAFLAAASLHEVRYHEDGQNKTFIMLPNPNRAMLLKALDRIDDAGLSAWIEAKTLMQEEGDHKAAEAREKATMGN